MAGCAGRGDHAAANLGAHGRKFLIAQNALGQVTFQSKQLLGIDINIAHNRHGGALGLQEHQPADQQNRQNK